MEGIYYGYVLQAQKKILENEKKADLKKIEKTVETPPSPDNKTKSVFGDHDQKTVLDIESYYTISYNTFLNPIFSRSTSSK